MSITPEDDDSDYINSPPVKYIFTEQENESSLTAITGDRSLTTHDYRCNNLSNAMTDLAVGMCLQEFWRNSFLFYID